MRSQRVAAFWLAGVMDLTTSTAAFAGENGQLYARSYRIDLSATRKAALRWEIGYLVLTAVDLAQTIPALHSGKFVEANPIVGKHPSAAKMILVTGIGTAAHFAFVQRLSRDHPKAALRVAEVSVGIRGAVVGLNFKTIF